MHVLDIAQNSIKANASLITITFLVDDERWLTILFEDNGRGMPPNLAAKATDPFVTTRDTRKVGLGIPLLAENAELTGGKVTIHSETGKGTTLKVTFDQKHIDCPPLGDMCDTLLALVVLNPDQPDFVYKATHEEAATVFDTRIIRNALGEVPLNSPDVVQWMRDTLEQEIKPILEVL